MKSTIVSEIKLSFCISSFNRASSVVRLVTDILRCPDEDFEVVILDNGSSDGTLVELAKINDARLKCFSNGTNKGALYNMVHVLEKGNGQFLVFSTDKDFIDFKQITLFKSFLINTPNLAAGFCSFEADHKFDCCIFSKGVAGVKNIAYKSRHPTGYFFNGDYLRELGLSKRFSDYDFVDLFPLEFAFAELCLKGNSAIYEGKIFKPASGKPIEGQKSLTTDGRLETAYFTPRSRLKMALNYTRHLASLDLIFPSKLGIAFDLFSRGLLSATIDYKSVMNNENLCLHYDMKQRIVGFGEIAKIALLFNWGFFKGTLKHGWTTSVFAFFVPIFFSIRLFRIIAKYVYSKFKDLFHLNL